MAAAAVLPVTADGHLPHTPSLAQVSNTLAVAQPPLLSRLPPVLVADPEHLPRPLSPPTYVGYTTSHLPSIDVDSLALHYALYKFHAVAPDYATRPYQDAFNWSDIQLPEDVEREWYIVAFRSKRRPDANTEWLYAADREAHEEAVTAGGLLLYWYGAVDENGQNLATCIWQSRQHALLANRNPKHVVAARLASSTYETYNLERYVLRKRKGSQDVSVETWTGGDVGF